MTVRTGRAEWGSTSASAQDSGVLRRLDTAAGPQDMDTAGLRLHPLKGDLAGHSAVEVSRNRRMTFRFDGADVRDVDLLDYH